ncbi:hypothetical protein [Microbispora hainanensis]|uniref:hypothetical protein n=1 Tax=Microbispora hainanensis TaxID=568844 RepID=UPI0032446BBE
MIPQLGSTLSERTATKVVGDAARYLLHEDGEQILFIGKTNQMKPLLDFIVLTNMRLVGVFLSKPAESPKVQAWWPQVRSFSFSEKWSSKNRLTLVIHEGEEIPFGTIREADVPAVRAQIERLTSPEQSAMVLRTLTARRDREQASEAARLREQNYRAQEWLRYRQADALPSSRTERTDLSFPPAVTDQVAAPAVPSVSTPSVPKEISAPTRPQKPQPALLDPALRDRGAELKPSPQEEQPPQADEEQGVEAPETEEEGPAAVPVGERSFLAEIVEARKKPRKWPYLLLICEIAGIAMRGNGWIVMATGFVVAAIVASVESSRSRPRVNYALTGAEASQFEEVVTAFRGMAAVNHSDFRGGPEASIICWRKGESRHDASPEEVSPRASRARGPDGV